MSYPSVPQREVRAVYDSSLIRVYQAYSPEIADRAIRVGTFVAPFRRERMTWIEPSFLWMMYRSGWGTKPGQQRVLALDITRAGFEEALSSACLSHFEPPLHPSEAAWRQLLNDSPVRVQWDPERTIEGLPLPHRSLQVGIGPKALNAFLTEWLVQLNDITHLLPDYAQGRLPLPAEEPYPLPIDVAERIGATPR